MAWTPVGALRRIAFLMERGREDTYRVKAYRTAVAALLEVGEDEVARRSSDGTLTALPGVGASTAEVVRQALAGEVPAKLAAAEKRGARDVPAGGAALRAALRGDLHSHSDWSDGGSPIEEMALTAAELGHEYLVLTDHSPRLTVARGLTRARLLRQLDVVDAVNAHLADSGFTLLKGIEVDINADGSLDQDDDLLARLDVRVASVHSDLRSHAAPMTRRMLAAVRSPHTNVLGHCTGQLVGGARGKRPPSDFDAEAVFAACVENDVAVEINARPERSDPPGPLLELARDLGCLFSIDSDAHAPGQLDLLAHGCARAEAAGIEPERIVNTWPKERLLAWANK